MGNFKPQLLPFHGVDPKGSEQIPKVSTSLKMILEKASHYILGKDRELKLALASLVANGHILLEDVPGVGKTTMARVLAHLMGLGYSRVQFTNDLLPADILGASIWDSQKRSFEFSQGPIFRPFLLADELNRATAKTQSAFLQAMEERKVTIDGHTHPLPEPFLIMATQNPQQQIGTFPIPESQLDRFLMRLELGFPDAQAELTLLRRGSNTASPESIEAVVSASDWKELQKIAEQVHCGDVVLKYIIDLVQVSRSQPAIYRSLSPRCSLDVTRAAKAAALIEGRAMVTPDDVQAVFAAVVNHRLSPSLEAGVSEGTRLAERLLQETPVPT